MPRSEYITREVAYKQVGAGWHSLLDLVYDAIEQAQEPEFLIGTVKEKFGTLRMYGQPADSHPDKKDFYDDLVNQACTASNYICETCGHLGEETDTSWIKVACPRHAPYLFAFWERRSVEPDLEDTGEFLAPMSPASGANSEKRIEKIRRLGPEAWKEFVGLPDSGPEVLRAIYEGLSTDLAKSLNQYELRYVKEQLAVHVYTPESILEQILADPTLDSHLPRILASRNDLPENLLALLWPRASWATLAELAPKISAPYIQEILHHPVRAVRLALASNPHLDIAALTTLASDPCLEISDTVLRRHDCPVSVLQSALAKNADLAPELAMNPATPPAVLEQALLATKPTDAPYAPYSTELATNILPRLIKAASQGLWHPSKACLAWALNHPDREVRLLATRLAPQAVRSI